MRTTFCEIATAEQTGWITQGATMLMGACYASGNGVEKDQAQAVHWYRKAVEQEHGFAQLGLGLCYENGEGVENDEAQAVHWYRKAAEQGNASCMDCLA